MQYLIATYWMWFVVALLVGGAVGYWLRRRFGAQKGSSQVLRWGAAAFLIGLVVAGLHWLPQRPGLYLEMLLLLSFWYAVGGLLGALLRGVTSATGSTRAALVADDLPDSAALARRARAAVKSAQDDTVATVASAGTIEDARLAVEAKATEVTRIVAATRAAHEERIAAEAKAAEAARLAAAARAAEETRRAIDAKAAEVTRIATAAKAAEAARVAADPKAAEEARLAAAAKAAEDARVAAEAKVAEEARIAAAAKAAEDARVAAEARAAEGARLAAAAKAAADAHAAKAKAAEEARVAAAAKAAEDARIAAEAKAAEKARPGAAAKPAKKGRLAAEARIAEGAREAASKVANDSGVAATAAVAGVETSHPGRKPAGIAVPAEGEADDLKWIKGIGPRNEKACHALGIYQFRQIAMWTPDEAIWVGHHMAFPGRIEREHWIAQARLLASGVATEHARAVKSGSLVVDEAADEPLDQAAAATLANSLPEQAAAVEGEDKHAGRRPYGLASALGQPDNLKKIRGIGPQNERRLHALGIWHFAQIAAWSEDNVKWVGSYLAFAGRIDREKWIAQARDLAAGEDTEFSRRVAAGKVATSKDDAASE
jgi:predicted flap endonuclease-1-like 5' DNA nuclease